MRDAARIAEALAAAERDRRARAPFTDEQPDLDEAAAYEAQWAGVRRRLERGERLVGAKVEATGRGAPHAANDGRPLYGWATSDMLLPYGQPVGVSRFIRPRVEPEIAFLLARPVATPASVPGVLAATEAVFAGVDLLDSRYAGVPTRSDVVADNAGAGAFLLGPRAVRPSDLDDLRLLGCVLRVGGEVVATAAGAAAMGHPAASVAWLANRLAAGGGTLKGGMLVFSGGLTEAVPLRPGTAVTVEFEQLGTIEVCASPPPTGGTGGDLGAVVDPGARADRTG